MTFRTIPIIIFCMISIAAIPQQHVRTDYPFIRKTFNKVTYSGDSSAFLRVFSKLDAISAGENKQLRIVHIGGSHIQAGLWSSSFVNALQEKFITAGGGYFVFPYKIGKTNGQPYATSFSNGNWKLCRSIGKSFCLPLGMNALSVSSRDSTNHFGVRLTKNAACKFVNRVKVYHNFSTSFEFDLCARDTGKVKRKEKQESGFTLFEFDMPVDSVCFSLKRTDTLGQDFILFGFSLENTLAPGFYLAGLGANGASSASFLKSEHLVPQLASIEPDLFILSLGVNDTQAAGFEKDEFIENYDTLITILRKAAPNAAVLLTTTTDNYIRKRTSNRRSITAKEAMFQLMLTHDIGVWDLFSLMGGYRSMTQWYKAGLASRDKVHFNSRGYAVVGELMFEAFIKAYEFNKTTQ